MHTRPVVILLAAALAAASGCKKSTATTAPTDTGPTAAAPTVTETFSGTLPVGGSLAFPFSVGVYGTVNVALLSVSGTGVPSTVMLGVGIGTPSNSSCTTTVSSVIGPSASTQLTAAEQPGAYCVNIADVGNLFRPATFTVTVAHP
jgi:hypothetical protein